MSWTDSVNVALLKKSVNFCGEAKGNPPKKQQKQNKNKEKERGTPGWESKWFRALPISEISIFGRGGEGHVWGIGVAR